MINKIISTYPNYTNYSQVHNNSKIDISNTGKDELKKKAWKALDISMIGCLGAGMIISDKNFSILGKLLINTGIGIVTGLFGVKQLFDFIDNNVNVTKK